MARGSRTENTFAEGLRRLLSEITDLKTLPDADLEFCINLETQVLERVRAGAAQAAVPPEMAAAGGAQPMGTFPAPPNGGVPGVMSGLGDPAAGADELRRVLEGNQ